MAEAGLVLNVTSDPANLARVRKSCEAFCLSHGLEGSAVHEVGLCVNEAMANVTRHVYGGATDKPVAVTVDAIGDGHAGAGVKITVRDWGAGVNPMTLPRKARDPETPGGLGLICLRELLDEVRFDKQPDGMLLTMIKRKK